MKCWVMSPVIFYMQISHYCLLSLQSPFSHLPLISRNCSNSFLLFSHACSLPFISHRSHSIIFQQFPSHISIISHWSPCNKDFSNLLLISHFCISDRPWEVSEKLGREIQWKGTLVRECQNNVPAVSTNTLLSLYTAWMNS